MTQPWSPEDFPQLTIDFIAHTSDPQMRADPVMTVLPTGWLFIETGNVRIAIPDEEEWNKLVYMGNTLFTQHNQQKAKDAATAAQLESLGE